LRTGGEGLRGRIERDRERIARRYLAGGRESGKLSPELLLKLNCEIAAGKRGMAGADAVVEPERKPAAGSKAGLKMETALRKIDVGTSKVSKAPVDIVTPHVILGVDAARPQNGNQDEKKPTEHQREVITPRSRENER
jgi:hypothetical protein